MRAWQYRKQWYKYQVMYKTSVQALNDDYTTTTTTIITIPLALRPAEAVGLREREYTR
jgi:hypothetical protein